MIFKTIDEKDSDGNVIGTQVVSFIEARKIAQEELNKSLAEQAAQLAKDKQCLLNYEQAVSQGNVTTEKFDSIMGKASISAKEHALATKGVAGSTDVFVKKQEEAQTQLQATTKASKAAKIGMQALATVGNMFLGMAISWGVSKIIEGIDSLTHSVEHCKERVDELMSSYTSAVDSANANADRVEELADKYENLSKGVNALGQNVSLTNDEYEEYNSLVNEIAEMFPTLIQGYTDEGNAILSLKGNVDELRDAYKEAQLEAYKLLTESTENSNDIINNYKNQMYGTGGFFKEETFGNIKILDLLEKMEEAALDNEKFEDLLVELDSLSKKDEAYYSEEFQNILNAVGINSQSAWGDIQENGKKFSKNLSLIQSYIQTYKAEINTALQDVQTLGNAFLNSFLLEDNYSNLSEEAKTAASIIVNSLDLEIASTFDSREKVGEYVANILNIITDSSTGVQDALVGLFTTDFSNMSTADAKFIVDEYINAIAKVLEENPLELKTRLNFDGYDTLNKNYRDVLSNAAQNASGATEFDIRNTTGKFEEYRTIYEKIDKFAKEYSINTQDEISAFAKALEKANYDINKAFEYYLVQLSTTNDIDVLSFSDLFNANSIDETKQKLLDLATSGELSSETITSTEEYKALLDQTTMSAQEFVNTIEKFNIDNLNASFEKYNDVLNRIRNGETLQANEISELIAEHEDLAGAVLISRNAYSIEEAALESIIDKYLEASNVAISHQLEQTEEVIEGIKTRLGFYGLEIEAMQRIANIANSYGTMKAVQFATGEYGYEIMPYVSDIISMAQQYSDAKNDLNSLSQLLEGSIANKAANENVAKTINEDIDKYKSLNDIIDVNTSLIQSQINLLESKGETIGRAYYEELLNHSTQRLSLLTEQYSSLKQDLANAMSNGIQKGSSEWLDMNNSTGTALTKSRTLSKKYPTKSAASLIYWTMIN